MSPSSQAQVSPQRILSTLQAYREAAALHTAIELELFTRIAHGNDTVNRIAADLGVPARGIRLICDSLAGAGLLTKDGEGLQLAPDAALYLDKRSPSYLGEAALKLHATPLLRGFERLTEFVRGAQPAESAMVTPDWFDIGRGLTDTVAAAGAFADAVALPGGPLKILDVGAGNGSYGIAIAARYPESVIVAADRPEELKIAQKNAVRAGLTTRYQNIPGDYPTMAFGIGFDAAILVAHLNQLDPAQLELLMKRLRHALKKTGRLLILDFLMPDNPAYVGFGLTMLTALPRGGAYTIPEVQDMLRSAGFASIDSQPFPAAHATLVTAQS